jgi:alpha-tubulin suppressor-like RCC1 family protein
MAAIKTDGTLWVWGFNNATGALGINDTTGFSVFRCTPVTTFAGGTNWKQVSVFGSATSTYNAAIKTDGTLWTWGNSGAVLGRGPGAGLVNICTPITTFAGGNDWKQVSCGSDVVAAIKNDGSLWTWGSNTYGQLGTDTITGFSLPTPTSQAQVNIELNWKQVSCGYRHVAAIKTDGSLWLWGNNGDGQLGDNTTIARSTPVTTFAGGNNWKQVSCTSNFTTAIKTDGTLWVWGNNILCNLGINDTRDRSTPVTTFIGGNSWRSCSSSMAIRSYDD